MAFTRKNDEAVSPVIGVILMVAITVILAAVIAAFVFGMSGNISKTKIVAVTVSRPTSTTVTVINNGGQDSPSLDYGIMSVVGETPSLFAATGTYHNGTAIGATANSLGANVGSTLTATVTATGKKEVIIVGHFIDATEQVLIDTTV